ncbi:MAG: hypothetical protein RL346_977 [Verrucomicrobiota bacterium]|jgi:RsiW-degrading membrane proteinase PrsW (M82 family)
MNWYYSDGQKVIGPLAEVTMMELRACGLIQPFTPVAMAGTEEWKTYEEAFRGRATATLPVSGRPPGPSFAAHTFSKVVSGISSAAGLEKLEGDGAKGLVSSLFRKRTIEELEESFAIGTGSTTPKLDQVPTSWPAPWVFVRLLMYTAIATVVFFWAINRFDNIKLYPGWLFMGAFAVPFSVMFFFVEVNVLRNISFYRVLKLLFLGGLISLVFALFLFEFTSVAHGWFGAMIAGPVEELAKILAVVFVARHWEKMHWTLNGILLGAAVGAGFAAFETAGYILEHAVSGGNDAGVMILRAFTAPFTHIIWTAATVGALWRYKADEAFHPGMLTKWPVLRVLVFVVALHAMWNSPLVVPFFGDFLGIILKFLILGIMGWILILLLIQSGLNQVKLAQKQGIEPSGY